MKLISFLLILIPIVGKTQAITGKWTTIDDNTGDQRSVVEIFEKEGKAYGKVVKIYPKSGEDPDPVCDKCPESDDRYNKKVIGMEIIKDMEKSGDSWSDGEILDPEVGKIYRCKIWIEGKELRVRGYWGLFYRTQVWKKVQ
jgi:uncharacterized protein (DUF2147 family)